MDVRKIMRKEERDLLALADQLGLEQTAGLERDALFFRVTCALLERAPDNRIPVQGVYAQEQTRDGVRGYLRFDHQSYLPSTDDVVVPTSIIQTFRLKTGDVVRGYIGLPPTQDMRFELVEASLVNGRAPESGRHRREFHRLSTTHPYRQLVLERKREERTRLSDITRMVDIVAPVGRGQRSLIVAPPRVGKTVLMTEMAKAIEANHPDVELIVLLIDERPEEVTALQETISSEVMHSTFDETADQHVQVAEMAIEKARRAAEYGRDVVILLDSITRLARAYNTITPSSGRVMTGGIDATALTRPKKFFGSARAFKEGGSLTIIATALVETGSKMDEVIFEEFKGTGNSEIILDRRIAEKRIFPAIDVARSGTRQDQLFFDADTYARLELLRRNLARLTTPAAGSMEAVEWLNDKIRRSPNNKAIFDEIGQALQSGRRVA